MNNEQIAKQLKDETLNVLAQFHSIQGEGPTSGAPAYMLTLRDENNPKGWTYEKTFEQIVKDFPGDFYKNLSGGTHLVINGGDPMEVQDKVKRFISYVWANLPAGYPIVEIETRGTIVPDNDLLYWVTSWNVSPELSNSGKPYSKRVKLASLEKYLGFQNFHKRPGSLKFRIQDSSDIVELLRDFVNPLRKSIKLNNSQVYLMPLAYDPERLYELSIDVAQFCKETCFNYSHRLQIAIWDQSEGA